MDIKRPRFLGLVVLVALVALVALTLGACGTSRSHTTTRTSQTAPPTTATSSPPSNAAPGAVSSGATSSAKPSSSETATGTLVRSLTLFAADGMPAPGVDVMSTATATRCLAFGVAGASSYRCFTAQTSPGGPAFVFDPCFAAAGARAPTTLLCPTDPATDSAVELHIASLPPASSGASRVWAIELPDRQMCVLVSAAWGTLGPFSCGHSDAPATEADCHLPVRGSPWWHVQCQGAETTSSPFVPLRVVDVWR